MKIEYSLKRCYLFQDASPIFLIIEFCNSNIRPNRFWNSRRNGVSNLVEILKHGRRPWGELLFDFVFYKKEFLEMIGWVAEWSALRTGKRGVSGSIPAWVSTLLI